MGAFAALQDRRVSEVDPQTDHPTDRRIRMPMRLAAQLRGRHNRRTSRPRPSVPSSALPECSSSATTPASNSEHDKATIDATDHDRRLQY
jgi:hypothetical protein